MSRSKLSVSDMIKALESGKRIRNTEWPDGHYWELQDGVVISVGAGMVNRPNYLVNDLFDYGSWIIVPKFVSFEEAIEAYKKGLLIECYLGNSEEPWAGYSQKASLEQDITFKEIIKGKWLIKEDEG